MLKSIENVGFSLSSNGVEKVVPVYMWQLGCDQSSVFKWTSL